MTDIKTNEIERNLEILKNIGENIKTIVEVRKRITKYCKITLVLLVIIIMAFALLAGCASQAPKVEDSNHYRVQEDYPCPECELPIPDKDVSPNIRIGNTCPYCREVFFGKPKIKSSRKKNYQSGYYGPYGPRIYGPTSVFRSNTEIEVFVVSGGGFKETETGFVFWNIWFRDIDIDRDYIRPFWVTTRY